MSLLNGKFDIPRGYPHGSALAEPFAIKKTGAPLAPVTLAQGKLVTQELQSGATVMDLATTPDLSGADPIDVWLVVEGNDDYSGEYVEKIMAVKCSSGVIWETDDFAAGAYTPGLPVTFDGGQLKLKGANDQIIGYVLDDLSSTKGTIRISS